VSAFTEPTFAWEPVTPRGVAAFARASLERLVIVQAIFALIAAGAVGWLLSDGVFPTIDSAIAQLPETGSIHGGQLDWREDSPVILAESGILAVSVDVAHTGTLHSPADFQVEFGRQTVRFFSLLGELDLFYPAGYTIAFNQPETSPVWGAWAPNILALTAIGTFFGLLLVWAVLATIYSGPVWLICFFANRDMNWRACWKLAGAALMPGAMLMSFSLVMYELRAFDLVQLFFAFGMHLVIGWIYLFVSPLFLNRALPVEKGNPFGGSQT
jgi:hypothetical protein